MASLRPTLLMTPHPGYITGVIFVSDKGLKNLQTANDELEIGMISSQTLDDVNYISQLVKMKRVGYIALKTNDQINPLSIDLSNTQVMQLKLHHSITTSTRIDKIRKINLCIFSKMSAGKLNSVYSISTLNNSLISLHAFSDDGYRDFNGLDLTFQKALERDSVQKYISPAALPPPVSRLAQATIAPASPKGSKVAKVGGDTPVQAAIKAQAPVTDRTASFAIGAGRGQMMGEPIAQGPIAHTVAKARSFNEVAEGLERELALRMTQQPPMASQAPVGKAPKAQVPVFTSEELVIREGLLKKTGVELYKLSDDPNAFVRKDDPQALPSIVARKMFLILLANTLAQIAKVDETVYSKVGIRKPDLLNMVAKSNYLQHADLAKLKDIYDRTIEFKKELISKS